jgi:hypothetical protein
MFLLLTDDEWRKTNNVSSWPQALFGAASSYTLKINPAQLTVTVKLNRVFRFKPFGSMLRYCSILYNGL